MRPPRASHPARRWRCCATIRLCPPQRPDCWPASNQISRRLAGPRSSAGSAAWLPRRTGARTSSAFKRPWCWPRRVTGTGSKVCASFFALIGVMFWCRAAWVTPTGLSGSTRNWDYPDRGTSSTTSDAGRAPGRPGRLRTRLDRKLCANAAVLNDSFHDVRGSTERRTGSPPATSDRAPRARRDTRPHRRPCAPPAGI